MKRIALEEGLLGKLPITICRYQLGPDTSPMPEFSSAFLHNTYKYTDLEMLLEYSVQRRGFAGIGYHFVINPRGKILATRPLDLQGAHVYGLNRASVGIAFLNIDACALSRETGESFVALHKELEKRSPTGSLPVYSHTYGQFAYLATTIERFNATENSLQEKIPVIPFDQGVYDNDEFQRKRREAEEIVTEYGKRHPEIQDHSNFRFIRDLVKSLKVCPGREYRTFVQLVGGFPKHG